MSLQPAVMVVDNDEELTNLYKRFLAKSGFNSVSFNDPLSALDHFIQNHDKYSVVLTDWEMPNLDGIQLAKRIREYSNTVKILLITSFFTDELYRKEAFQEARVSAVIEKPILLDELKLQLEELC